MLRPRRHGIRGSEPAGVTSALRRNVLDPAEVFLAKPFTLDALTRKVREVLDRPPAVHAPHDAYGAPNRDGVEPVVTRKRKADR
jgi:hypothetical protein